MGFSADRYATVLNDMPNAPNNELDISKYIVEFEKSRCPFLERAAIALAISTFRSVPRHVD